MKQDVDSPPYSNKIRNKELKKYQNLFVFGLYSTTTYKPSSEYSAVVSDVTINKLT